MNPKHKKIYDFIEKLVKEILQELSTTGNVAGYSTPFAFTGKDNKTKKKRLKQIKKDWKYTEDLEDADDIMESTNTAKFVYSNVPYDKYAFLKSGKVDINEELTIDDIKEIKDIIRIELASVMFDLFKKRQMWI